MALWLPAAATFFFPSFGVCPARAPKCLRGCAAAPPPTRPAERCQASRAGRAAEAAMLTTRNGGAGVGAYAGGAARVLTSALALCSRAWWMRILRSSV